jgi:hypothetical protein
VTCIFLPRTSIRTTITPFDRIAEVSAHCPSYVARGLRPRGRHGLRPVPSRDHAPAPTPGESPGSRTSCARSQRPPSKRRHTSTRPSPSAIGTDLKGKHHDLHHRNSHRPAQTLTYLGTVQRDSKSSAIPIAMAKNRGRTKTFGAERSFRRLGGVEDIKVSTRVLCATFATGRRSPEPPPGPSSRRG